MHGLENVKFFNLDWIIIVVGIYVFLTIRNLALFGVKLTNYIVLGGS